MKIISDIERIFLTGTAIYVSDDFVDIAKGRRTANGLKVFFLQRYPLLKKIDSTPYEDAREELDNILDKAFADDEPKPYRVAVNLRNDSFILRHFTLRGVQEKNIKQAITFEAQRYMSYTTDELVYGFKAYSRYHDSQEVIFAAAEKKDIHEITEYFEAKNVLPSIIEATPVLITRALNLEGLIKKEGVYMSIHYEPANKAVITGIYNRQPHFFREMRIFPGDEEFKTAELNYMPLKDVWAIIERDIVASAEYMRKETKKDIEKIFISGFTYSPDEKKISAEFGIPLARAEITFFGSHGEPFEDRSLPVAALLHDSLNKPFLNLAPDDIVRRDLWRVKPALFTAAAALVAIIAIHMAFLPVRGSARHKTEDLRRRFTSYSSMNPDAPGKDILRYSELTKDKARLINNLIVTLSPVADKLRRIGNDVTDNSWIDEIEYRGVVSENPNMFLRLKGAIYAGGEQGVASVNNIVQNFNKDKRIMRGFKKVELASLKKNRLFGKEITEFEIMLK